MKTLNTVAPVVRIPLSIAIDERNYNGQALSKRIPSAILFSCDLDGLGMYIIEAVINPLTKKHEWTPDSKHEDNHVHALLKHALTKHLAMA